jgi:uncharacterized protein (TIGR04255 family)
MADANSPSFTNPPLDEVILGVQFAPAPGFNSTFHANVYSLFQREFPVVDEHPPLAPQIEAFGGNPSPGFQINFGTVPTKSRLWFISDDNGHLIQFQDDRLLFNWQNRAASKPYPRHERMSEIFGQKLKTLSDFYGEVFGSSISITQAEVAYVNIIPLSTSGEIGDWLRIFNPIGLDVEGLNLVTSRVLYGDSNQPIARIFYEAQMVFHQQTKKPALRFVLTCRGKPYGDTIAEALKFTTFARNRIVEDFCRFTTENAQKRWGRQS